MSRYLLRQFLSSSALFLLGLLVTWMTAESVLHLDRFRSDPGSAWKIMSFRTLEVVPLGLPIACLMGAVWSLTRAARFLELTAIRSGGIRLRRVLAPILITSLGLAGAIALFEDRILVPVRTALPGLGESRRAADLGTAHYTNDRWWFAHGGTLFSARAYDPDAAFLEDVTVFFFDDQRRMTQRIDAARAEFEGDQVWRLRDARIAEFDGGVAPQFRQEPGLSLTLGVSEQQIEKALPSPETRSLHSLARSIREWSGSTARLATLEASFHARLAKPLALVVLVLFGVGLSVVEAEHRDTLGRALLRAMIAATIYWSAWTGALVLAGSGHAPPALTVWGITLLFLGLGVLRFRRIPE